MWLALSECLVVGFVVRDHTGYLDLSFRDGQQRIVRYTLEALAVEL